MYSLYFRFYSWTRKWLSRHQGGLCLFILMVIFSRTLSCFAATKATLTHNLIILNPSHPGFKCSSNDVTGVLQGLRQRYPSLNLAFEYLYDFLRARDYLTNKYRGRQFDLVIALDDPALKLYFRHDLFPGIP
jgi:hypothetical protein